MIKTHCKAIMHRPQISVINYDIKEVINTLSLEAWIITVEKFWKTVKPFLWDKLATCAQIIK